jgi:hypothetical protein
MLVSGGRTEVGRGALATVMAAVVESAGGETKTPDAWYGRFIGNINGVAEARKRRAAALTAAANGASPQEALDVGEYLFQRRQTRSDKLSAAMVAVIDRCWHSEEVSRGNGNTNDVKKASKHKDAAKHAARVQILTAAAAYELFLGWREYKDAKEAEGWAVGKDVSFTVFQLHKCFCICAVSTPALDFSSAAFSFSSRCTAATSIAG